MKKILLLSALALSLGMASCDNYNEPNPPAQSNPQLEIFKATDIQISKPASTALDLAAAAKDQANVVVAKIDQIAYFPETYDLQFVVEYALDENFSKYATVPAGYEYGEDAANVVYVDAAQMNDSISTTFTKDPAAQDGYIRIAAYAVQGTSFVRLGAADDNYYYNGKEPWAVSIVRVPADHIIYNEYVLVGSFCNWNVAQGIAVPNTDKNASPYDNPTFQVVFDVTAQQAADGFLWKIVPAGATSLDNAYAPADNSLTEGALVEAAGQDNAGVVRQQGRYMLKFNMEDLTYAQSLAIESLYVPGQGSSVSNFSRVLQLTTDNYVTYTGVARLRNTWYLTAQPSNTGIVYRSTSEETADDGVITGEFEDNANGAMMTAGNALYYLDVNVVKQTYKASPLNQISLIGVCNSWGLETAVDLTHSSNFLVWTLKDKEMPVGEYKFCCNHSWTLSFGGSEDNIVQNGGNLNITEAGTYDFSLDFSKIPYVLTVTKK